MWHVYVLKSGAKRWYYIGSTNRLERRIQEHNQGKVISTKAYRPLILVYKEQFDTELNARQREHQLKGKRIAKEEIIRQIESHGGIV